MIFVPLLPKNKSRTLNFSLLQKSRRICSASSPSAACCCWFFLKLREVPLQFFPPAPPILASPSFAC
ncbi:hypothetical protein SLEP1_g18266 [Rubroshorea leprosula]|uniref:Uncharacterized protein n=1 Tax=Rubroshorea leprosula TaxID=152421 RepID=A0AAV5IWV7_9ROSI|nr:hypothetical protein SLEP1_g18266 [Rubroshorea leprosula]